MTSSSDEAEFDHVPIGRLSSNGEKRKNHSIDDASAYGYGGAKKKAVPDAAPSSSSKSVKIKASVPKSMNGTHAGRSSTSASDSASAAKKRPKVEIKDDSDREEIAPPKKIKSEPSTTVAIKVKKQQPSGANGSTNNSMRTLKKMERAERLSHAMLSFLWWDAPVPPEGCQWGTMEHAGVSFPEPYEPHGVKLLYDGEPTTLNPVEEEAATFFAAMDPDGMHLGNPKTAPIFIKNFFADFKEVLSKPNKKVIKEFKKCNFDPIRHHLNRRKIIKKAITDQQRAVHKEERNTVMFQFGYALVDNHIEKVGNYNMEPPGAFRGRGEHPKMGKLKTRVAPEQVALNVSECARVPPCSVPGHAWGELRHDPAVQWLSQWKENINNQVKYMQLAAQSSFKGKSDRSKYSKAALLCDNIDKIRDSYKKKLKAKSLGQRQLATAMWVIDRLALRVGGEKDTDEEADTVGCCSLRVEHLHFDPNGEGDDNKEIELEFLGKDSMLFKQTIDFGAAMYTENNGMGEQVYDNFKLFCRKKKDNQEVFDSLTPSILNAHLKEIMDGLTAKVFRTYNASKTLQDQLSNTENMPSWNSLSAAEKVVKYNNANREVAILCNHQRSVSKAQETQLGNLSGKLDKLKEQKRILKAILKRLNSGSTTGIPLKKDEKKATETANKAIDRAKKLKEDAKSNDEKIEATQADEAAKQLKRDAADYRFTQAHLWDKIPTKDQVIKRITTWTQKIAKMEMALKHKDDNKEVSLGTSKLNYMDPRISVAWCKRNEVPIEKIFSKTMRDKFNWAMAVPSDWQFNAGVAKQGQFCTMEAL